MAFAVRIWPVEFDPSAASRDWGPLRYGGALGAEAPWRFEPSYWDTEALREDHEPIYRDGYVDYEFDLTLDEARSLDASYRARALPWMAEIEFPEVDRALALDSSFTKFHVIVYEWESGLA